MEPKEVLDELKAILVSRLKFDPRRAAETTEATPLPKGVDGSIGLDLSSCRSPSKSASASRWTRTRT